MIPAFARAADTAAKAPLRLGIVYVPNGMSPMGEMDTQNRGRKVELTPTMESIIPFRDKLVVLSGLYQKEAMAIPGEGAQDHSRACATFLSGVRIKVTARQGSAQRYLDGSDHRTGSQQADQLASLELSLCANELVGTCEPDYSCVYLSTFCWKIPPCRCR